MDGTWENAAHQSSLGNIIIADRDTQQSINRNGHGNQEKEEERSSWSAKVEPKAEAVALQTICVVIIWAKGCLLYTKKCYRCYGRVKLLWIPTTTDSTKRYKRYFPEFDNSFSSINLNAKPTWVLSIQLNGYKKGPSAPVSLRIHRTGGTDHPIERIEFQMRNNGDVFDGFTTVVVIFFIFDQRKMEPLIPEDHLFPLVEMCKICPGPWHWQCPGDQCIFINKC